MARAAASRAATRAEIPVMVAARRNLDPRISFSATLTLSSIWGTAHPCWFIDQLIDESPSQDIISIT
jgi:hypothetical protein